MPSTLTGISPIRPRWHTGQVRETLPEMRGVMLSLTLAVVGCFGPVPPSGAPCSAANTCPDPLVCSPATVTCEPTATAVDAPFDSTTRTDAPSARDCWPLWRAGTVTLTAPTVVSGASTLDYEHDPTFVPGDRELYFARGAGTEGEIHRASRSSPTAPFNDTGIDSTLSAPGHDGRVSAAGGHTTVVLSSSRAGGAGGEDLFQADRASLSVPFGAPSRSLLLSVEAPDSQVDPELTTDGLRLYYSNVGSGSGIQAIWFASRPTVTDAFGAPSMITINNAPGVHADPALSADELVMIYTTLNGSHVDLRLARRASITTAFTDVGELPINTTFNEGDADFSENGCEIVFASDRAGGVGSRDIWLTTVTEMP